MRIKRVQVEEGFLDGLDLELTPGLNVLIGPRGTGKTSVIELIRYCLRRPSYNEEIGRSVTLQAISLLGRGQVIVTLTNDSGDDLTITRSADDKEPRVNPPIPFPLPIMLSQNEIERLGVDAPGRLSLLDDFRRIGEPTGESVELVATISSITAEVQGLSQEAAELAERLEEFQSADSDLEAALAQQKASQSVLSEVKDEQEELGTLSKRLAEAAVRRDAVRAAAESVNSWIARIRAAEAPVLEPWSSSGGETDLLQPLRTLVGTIQSNVAEVQREAEQARALVLELQRQQDDDLVPLEDAARKLRQRLAAVDKNAAEAAQVIADAEERAGLRNAAADLLAVKQGQLKQLVASRGELLDELERIRDEKFAARDETAALLNSLLEPAIRVEVVRAGLPELYGASLTTALRGSGLHVGRLVPQLTERIPPRELVELVESGNAEELGRNADFPVSRAARVIAHLSKTDCSSLLTLPIEDEVRMLLLDGSTFKATERLSMGQRCTVMLPLLLAHRDAPLIVDQPEDNLDNSFIVSTVVESIRKRRDSDQVLFATHNPNIPVLGEANQVILMGSDGNRGFVADRGPLDSPQIVDAITRIMEGGRDAFERRAAFYSSHAADGHPSGP